MPLAPYEPESSHIPEAYLLGEGPVGRCASCHMAKTAKKGPYHVPVCWVKDFGQGKAMHMSLGHREDVWTNPTYQESLLGGIRWIMGLEEGDATPNPDLSAAQEEKARRDAGEG